jgi:hypothetical protein
MSFHQNQMLVNTNEAFIGYCEYTCMLVSRCSVPFCPEPDPCTPTSEINPLMTADGTLFSLNGAP